MARVSLDITTIIKALLSGISITKLKEIARSIEAFIYEAEKQYPASGTGTQKFDYVEAKIKEAFSTIWAKNGGHFIDWLIQTIFSGLKLAEKI